MQPLQPRTILSTSEVIQEFNTCIKTKYTGMLEFTNSSGHRWHFHYHLGSIIWASGGFHPYRRWRRNIERYAPGLNWEQLFVGLKRLIESNTDYKLVLFLQKQGKIQPLEACEIAESTIKKLVFDVLQQSAAASSNATNRNLGKINQVCQQPPIISEVLGNRVSTESLIKKGYTLWQNWVKVGLSDCYPDQAPILRQPELLAKEVNATIYHSFVQLFNGKNTLRDLTLKTRQDILLIGRSLLPYTLRGLIELVDVPDLINSPEEKISNTSQPTTKTKSSRTLIACVDDSPQICQSLEQIIQSAGMDSLKIIDPIQALPTLIQQQPDLIFLDLIMPMTNGFEICKQLRRMSRFANTPIVILTSSEGSFDQARAKAFGATDFIQKPVNKDAVLGCIREYLRVPSLLSMAG
ncbi:hypothetical protein IJ00_04525 [Calothrix sp. 336/3]|nr:hypothetical protein IJ00_04525 [Calothrix sp. 336/3]